MRAGSELFAVVTLVMMAGNAASAQSGNPVHDNLLAATPQKQAEALAKAAGQGCVGKEAFPMGVSGSGRSEGYAYWSVRCTNGKTYAVQLQQSGVMMAIPCSQAEANGLHCFKKF